MEPIFFFLRRTNTQLRIIAATSFSPDGKYTPMSSRHPQYRQADELMRVFSLASRGKSEHQITPKLLIEGVRTYIGNETADRMGAISKTATLPERIVLRAK